MAGKTFAILLTALGGVPKQIVSLSALEAALLNIIKEQGELTGYDIAKYSDGKISVAVVYTLISRLHKKGLIASRTEKELVEDAMTKGRHQKLEKRYWRMIDGLLLVKGGDSIYARDDIPTNGMASHTSLGFS